MPEYSSTTITPSDGVQVPGMNGSTSGNFLLSALKSYILSEKGLANGLASLDGNGKLTASQLPDLADDVIVVASYSTLPATGTAGKIYITADTNTGYRWDPELTTPGYVKIFEIDKSIVFGYYSSGSFYEDSEHTVQITPVEHVLYVDVSLADIYVLNDGTLIELLGTKWAKITDIQDGTIQAGIAVKAFQDAMGRAIITTYATKAELSAEESSREAADSNLKSAIDNNSQRIENLEVAVSGSLVQTNVLTDPPSMANVRTITNANSILPWAILKRVGARAVAWNQQLRAFSATNWWNSYLCTPTYNGYHASLVMAGPIGNISTNFKKINNHVYLITFGYKISKANIQYNIRFGEQYFNFVPTLANVNCRYARIVTSNASSDTANFTPMYSDAYANGDTVELDSPKIIDLSFMNMETGYTADELADMFSGDYPANLGTLIPLNPSAFKVVGKNKFDGVIEVGAISNSTGANDDSRTDRSRSKNYIEVEPNTRYYTSYDVNIICYDFNKNFINYLNYYTAGSNFLIPANCFYVRFYTGLIAPSTQIQFCLNSVTDKTYEEYKETTIDTSFTSDYKYVNENCHDYSENVLVNGVMRREEHKGIVDSYTFTGNEAWSLQFDYYLVLNISGKKRGLRNFMVESGYISPNYTGLWDSTFPNGTWGGNTTNSQIVYKMVAGEYPSASAFAQHIAGKTIYFENASPSTPTLHDPIPNIPCEDGTTVTAITPQTDIVNSVDVPSTIAYMTKIGG